MKRGTAMQAPAHAQIRLSISAIVQKLAKQDDGEVEELSKLGRSMLRIARSQYHDHCHQKNVTSDSRMGANSSFSPESSSIASPSAKRNCDTAIEKRMVTAEAKLRSYGRTSQSTPSELVLADDRANNKCCRAESTLIMERLFLPRCGRYCTDL